ncbi:MAG: EAL domain-containing protein [Sulfuricurvum sp.]
MTKALLAKQPILNSTGEVIACELLFRSSEKNYATIDSNSLATACVIANAFSIGVENIVKGRLAFINVDREFLLSDAILNLPSAQFVIEILEDVIVDDEILQRVRELKDLGYTLAIDDFDLSVAMFANFESILEYISIIKVDLIASGGVNALGSRMSPLKQYGLKLLIEKVESIEEYEACKELGFDYFQGYFFQKPIMVEGKKIDPLKSQVASIIGLLNKDCEIDVVVNEIQKSPELSINLLRYINSSAFTTKNSISSIHQVITLLGKSNLNQYLLLFLYTGSNNAFSSPLIEASVMRANIMQNLALKLENDKKLAQKAYLTGLLSFFDAIMQLPLDMIKDELFIDEEILDAITTKRNKLGEFLKISRLIERGEWEDLALVAKKYNTDIYELTGALSCQI